VYLNKTDIRGCVSVEEVTKALELDRIHTHRWTVTPCSAMTGENLEKGLGWVEAENLSRPSAIHSGFSYRASSGRQSIGHMMAAAVAADPSSVFLHMSKLTISHRDHYRRSHRQNQQMLRLSEMVV
jgi:hypothetical protein